jgi:hypothetical protein
VDVDVDEMLERDGREFWWERSHGKFQDAHSHAERKPWKASLSLGEFVVWCCVCVCVVHKSQQVRRL